MPEAPSILEPKQEKPSKARIRRVAERVVGKRGEKPVTVTEAMRKEGYSEATIQNPKNITASKTWKEIMDELVPEDKVAKVIEEALDATDAHITPNGKVIKTPDHHVRLKAADMAIKVRGGYAAEKHQNLNMNFSLAELRKMRDAGEI